MYGLIEMGLHIIRDTIDTYIKTLLELSKLQSVFIQQFKTNKCSLLPPVGLFSFF